MGGGRRRARLGGVTDVPELRRDRADAKVAGVCAALARAWNVDPLLVRLGFVVLVLLTNGFAAAAYLALAVLIPERGARSEPVRDLLPFTRAWSSQKLVAAVVAGAVVLGLVVSGSGPGAIIVALLVLAIMRWGTRARQPAAPHAAAPVPSTEFERLSAVWQQRVSNVRVGLPPDWAPAPAPTDLDPFGLYADAAAPAPPHPARRRRSLRTWSGVVLALGLLWAGLAVVQANGVEVPTLAACSATLAVLAVALVAVARPGRAWYGRPRGLLPAAVVAGVTTAFVMVGGPGMAQTGDRPAPTHVVSYTDSTLPAHDSFGMGSRTIDLSGVSVDRDRTVRLGADMGRLRVVLPAEGNVVVNYRVDMGSATIAGTESGGTDIDASWRRVTDDGGPTLTLDVSVDLGALEVVVP